MYGRVCEDQLNKPEQKKQVVQQKAAGQELHKAQSTPYRTVRKDSPARRKELKKRRQTGTVQKRNGRMWGVLGMLACYLVFRAWNWLDEQGVDLGGVVTRIVQYFEEDTPAEDVPRTEDEAAKAPDEAMPAEAEKQEWDTGNASYYQMCLDPGNYTVGYDIPAGSYQLECREGSAWIYVSNPEGTDWEDYEETLYSEDYQEQLRENDGEDAEYPYSAYSDVLDLFEDQVLYIETVYEGVWVAGLKADGAVLAKRDPQGLQTVHYQDGMEPGDEIPEGVYDLVLRNPETSSVYLQIHGEDGTEMYLALSKDTPAIRRISIQEGDTLEYDDYDTGAEVDFVPSY